jgi:hypothetical protein
LHSWQFQGLLLTKKEFQTYHSEFDLNYTQYDYQERENAGSKYINWYNEHFTATQAAELASQFRQESYTSNKLHLSGLLSLMIGTMNHPDYSFESNWKTLFKDFNFNFIEHTVRTNFVEDYKKKLLQIVNNQ